IDALPHRIADRVREHPEAIDVLAEAGQGPGGPAVGRLIGGAGPASDPSQGRGGKADALLFVGIQEELVGPGLARVGGLEEPSLTAEALDRYVADRGFRKMDLP